MQILASCRKLKRRRRNSNGRFCGDVGRDATERAATPSRLQNGFTLLEVLVVLAIVGLMSAVALPQFAVIRDRLEFSLSRESFEQELRGLTYRALTEGRPLILSGQYPRDAKNTPQTTMSDNPYAAMVEEPMQPGTYRAQTPINADDVPLTLPPKWKVVAEKPVVYQASGFCSGGVVTLVVGAQRYIYDLKAPECRVELTK